MNELEIVASALSKGIFHLKKLKDLVYPESIQQVNDEIFFLARLPQGKRMIIAKPRKTAGHFQGETHTRLNLMVCPLSEQNASALRAVFPWTAPRPAGGRRSFGTGDRIGVATPGHVQTFRGRDVFPVLAQQSMREMSRTGRSPRQVIDDACWGVFEAHFTRGFAADADHIKQIRDAVNCYHLGFTMFTIDAGDFINTSGPLMSDAEAESRLLDLDEDRAIQDRYLGKGWFLADNRARTHIRFTKADLGRAAVTYWRAIRHIQEVYEALRGAARGEAFDFEISVDETSTPTLPKDHFFIVNELQTRGVTWTSLAPRFIGEFQKGIEYMGDLDKFAVQFSEHALIARKCGGYKISVHSGSDKFSIFPLVGRLSDRHFHVKTAGTSWLEAVRIIARHDPDLYMAMHAFALEHFEKDRQSYHVSTNLETIPPLTTMLRENLEDFLDMAAARQLMHITYGSILSAQEPDGMPSFKSRIYHVLALNEAEHYQALEKHLGRHIDLLMQSD